MSYLPDYCILALVPTFEGTNTSSYFYRLVLTGEGFFLLDYLWSHSPGLDLVMKLHMTWVVKLLARHGSCLSLGTLGTWLGMSPRGFLDGQNC